MLLYRLMHCAKNNLNLRIKSEPATAGANATVYVCQTFWNIQLLLAQESDWHTVLYHCISSNRDRHGYYAEIQIIFGTVCWHQQLSWCGFLHTRQVHDARDAFTLAEAFFTDASAYIQYGGVI